MLIETTKLIGAQIDWAVAKCEGIVLHPAIQSDGYLEIMFNELNGGSVYNPSTNWSQGGPIIDREDISVIKLESDYVVNSKGYTTGKRNPVFGAVIGNYFDTDQQRNSYGESYGEIYYIGTEDVTTGPTPLAAAMRCFVASKMGETIDIPDELCSAKQTQENEETPEIEKDKASQLSMRG